MNRRFKSIVLVTVVAGVMPVVFTGATHAAGNRSDGAPTVPRIQLAQYTKTPGGYPDTIHRGWPGLVFSRMDAAIFWSTEKSYIFYKDSYVRYNNKTDTFDTGYPRLIRDGWKGVNFDRVDAAVKWPNGKTYFFGVINTFATTTPPSVPTPATPSR